MDILVIGGGGREHAVIKKLKESPRAGAIYCAPGNGGIAADARCVPIKATDVDGVVRFAKDNRIGFVVVTPDDPLALGMVDALEAAGIKAFGPNQAAAAIESSKVFSKNLMKKYGIPTAAYDVFESPIEALAHIVKEGRYPAVIKADGLALGKGVVIAQNEDEARAALHAIMEDKIFGASGNRVVVEEFLTGPEVSVLAFTDGKTIRPMVSSKDHKRALDGDKGPNTGGMGTISPNPHYTDTIADQCMETIFLPTVHAMNAEGRPFKGCLYFGLMLTPDGPKVIEYNARFGDPETQVVLLRLQSDLLDILEAVADERLAGMDIEWDSRAAACVVAASGGYPGKYASGKAITGIAAAETHPDVTVFHAGTRLEDGTLVTAGGRVLGVTALGATLEQALGIAYAALREIHFDGMQFRTDIGR
ncbi:phosphoribosylamine--glycine ligase [Ethanoligenens harbinense]|uniref:Phosphoribosylamine--glycine ligase n=1 Tax=Ethanoligenens harbinense (strain DSM 18485 / JCM 12961 / CGMCC 1.5033 / YUAN-3) TaxID=663278 RepID=E6U6Q2_ETHHY|nr:phosphoribosylamine--glycine ligase [Ethanoligenens harbinense]ADU25785.1 phosphoribosylamine/glycine ligase [Ethanoligenens harbinense YUAN-3]AVQ94953.1 phosphoribosylamine--glycine ligase [Ethanoligenens harbinense YUAN-3]AYF37645.1 phosphoribosylamine--glycine ligase [Ethanoligenens harbinense]AYF40365.1 phosphoribosylamine--glycine ligase [Ethanoligenens harbinense]QCN91201.1 phosphoribosylamine--glycine ligase [Ethanoligenens harbinense]